MDRLGHDCPHDRQQKGNQTHDSNRVLNCVLFHNFTPYLLLFRPVSITKVPLGE